MTSIRSSRARGMVSVVLAVVMNRHSRQVKRELQDSDPGMSHSARCPAPPAGPRTGRHGNRCPACRSRPAAAAAFLLPACWMAGDDPARHSADIGLAVAANFGLVVDAAQGDARQLPVQAPGDAEWRWMSCRRPEGRPGRGSAPCSIRRQLPHCQGTPESAP